MFIETLTTATSTSTLAAIDSASLRQLRDNQLRNCFTRFDEVRYRMEFVARIHDKEYYNDAMARSVNATLYTMENMDGGLIWIAQGGDTLTDYTRLRSVVLRKVHALVSLGPAAPLRRAFGDIVPIIEEVDTMAQAAGFSRYAPLDHIKVLFSPASSVGLPVDEAGRLFSHEVNEL